MDRQSKLAHAYRHARAIHPEARAIAALAYARAIVDGGRQVYAPPPIRDHRSAKARTSVFFERDKLLCNGFRFVGYADEIHPRVAHKGWFADAHESSTYRGIVHQLPGHGGSARYVAGYVDSQGGGYVLDLSAYGALHIGETGVEGWRYDGGASDAALAADEFARVEAEKAREWSEAWQAGQDYATALEEAREEAKARRELSKLARLAVRDSRLKSAGLDRAIFKARRDSRAAYERADNLKESIGSSLYAAFNDGAGEHVLGVGE